MSTAPVDSSAMPSLSGSAPIAVPGSDSVDDLLSELGLEADGAGDKDGAPAKEPPAPKADPEKTQADQEAKGEEGAEGDEKKADDVEASDEDKIAAIMARSRQRARDRKAREAQARGQETPAAKPAEAPAKQDAKPTEAAAPKPGAEISAAVRDVLLQLDQLASDDAAAGQERPATAAEAAAASTERRKALEAIQEKLEALSTGAKQTEEMRTEIASLKDTLQSIQNTRAARTWIARELDSIETEIPSLMDPSKLRDLKRADGSRYRDPVDVIHDAATRFYEKYKATPDLKALARRIEKKLGASPEKTANEKTSPSRKTVSASLGSPPAARTGPDKRSKAEVEKDFFAAIGVDPND